MAVSTWGKGMPDYSQNVERALTRKRLVLEYNQATKIFIISWSDQASPYSWIQSPMESEQSAWLIDAGTGLPMPFTVPQGYVLSIIYAEIATLRLFRMRSFIDGYMAWEAFAPPAISAPIYYEQEVYAIGTDFIDPTGASAHTLGYNVYNYPYSPIGSETRAYGLAAIVAILEAVSTPEITSKMVKCKFCNATAEVDYDVGKWTCPSGHQNLYLILPFGGKK